MLEKRSTIFNYAKYAAILLAFAAGIYLVIKLGFFFLPIVLGFLVATLLEYPIAAIKKKIKFPRSILALVFTLVFYVLIGFILFLIITKLVNESIGLVNTVRKSMPEITSFIEGEINRFQVIFEDLDPTLLDTFEKLLQSIVVWVQSLLAKIGGNIFGYATNIPSVLFQIIIMLLSTILCITERERFASFTKKQFPSSWMKIAIKLSRDSFGAIGGYFKAQLKIMVVVFLILTIAFRIINLKYAFLFSVLVALLDALPIFGAGVFLLPASVVGFFQKDYRFAIGILIIYVVVLFARQMIEPRIVGKEIGLNPLVSLTAVFVGFKLFGAIGLIGGPIIAFIYKSLVVLYMGDRTINDIVNGVRRSPIEDDGSLNVSDAKKKRSNEESEKVNDIGVNNG